MSFPFKIRDDVLTKALKLGVRFEDVEEQFVRGSGKGEQKMNKTSSCVLMKHLPSGLEVRTQRFRELTANREEAFKLLVNKIEEKVLGEKSEKAQKLFKLRKQKKKRSKRAKDKMIDSKKRRSVTKQGRADVKRFD